jgi:magnesium-transporting ATPase (P-type)
MNVFCTDKTGMLTEGEVKIHAAIDITGNESDRVLFYAYLNATSESGYANPIDDAIRQHKTFDISSYHKLYEVPYDFNRKRLSILFSNNNSQLIITKGALKKLSDEALMHRVQRTNVFAEVEPNQKERIIIALKKAGNVVGYMGDGINDASALHAADVSISVESAVDVAKEAADIVLMQKDLNQKC